MSGQVLEVKYDTGAERFFVADNDDVPGGTIVQSTQGITKIWSGTQTEYDAITTPDNDTLYVITE